MASCSYADGTRSAHRQQYGLFDGLKNKPELSGFSVSRIEEQLNDKFPLPELKKIHDDPGSYWFSNEFPYSDDFDFKKTINKLSRLPTDLRSRSVSIITGEGCLFSCLPELAKICSLVFQVDHDPKLLHLSQLLISSLADVEDVSEDFHWLDQAIIKLRDGITEFHSARVEEIHTQYAANKAGMGEYHCFSSEQRLRETKNACASCKVIPIYADFYLQDDMATLAGIIKSNNIQVVFINLSNILEYLQDFYAKNKFNGIVIGVEPTRHIRNIPLNEYTLCAFSSLITFPFFTRVCNKERYYEELYLLAKKNSDDIVEQLATRYLPISSSRYLSTESTKSPLKTCLVLAKASYPYSFGQASLRLALSRLEYLEALELQKQRSSIESILKRNQCIEEDDAIEFLSIIDTAIAEQFAAKKFQRILFDIP